MFLFRDFTLDAKREIRLALRLIYGVGWRKAILVSAAAGIGYPFYLNKINGFNFTVLSAALKTSIISDVRIKRRIEFNISRLTQINNVKGLRHKLSLPIHGQRTRTNASTQRTKRVRRATFNNPKLKKQANTNKNKKTKKK